MDYIALKHQNASINLIEQHPEIPMVFLIGGFGSGKSFTDVLLCLYLYARLHTLQEQIHIGVLGVTIKLLKQTVIADLERAFDNAGIPYKDNSQAGTLTVGNITFIYLAMQNPDDIYAHNFHCAICDEIDEVEPSRVRAIVTAIQERCRVRLPVIGGPSGRDPFIFFSTTAQGMGGTYQLVKYFQKQNVPYAIVRGRTQDNPHIAKTQLDLLKKLYTPEEQDAYLNGKFINLTNGRVYWAFNRSQHVCMRFPWSISDTIYVGHDFNALHNASCDCIVRNGVIYVIASHHFNDMGVSLRMHRRMYPENRIVYIPDASGKEIMRGFAEEAEESRVDIYWNTTNPSITERLMVINKAYMWGQLKIMEGQPGYADPEMVEFDKRNSLLEQLCICSETRDFDDATGKPRKIYGENGDHQNDSCFVAGTLIETSRGPVPIEQVHKGDHVLSHDGRYHRVKWAGKTGLRRVISRFGLTGTPNHPVADWDKNFVALADASEYTMYDKEALRWLRRLYLTELSIGDIRMQKGELTVTISELELKTNRLLALAHCTGTCGLLIMDLYQKAMTYITRMETHRTMIYRIWNVYRLRSILRSMSQHVRGSFPLRLMKRLRPGIEAKLGTNSSAGCLYADALGAISNLRLSHLNSEALLTGQGTEGERSFAQGIAAAVTTMQSASDVYNLSVTGTHTYYANGILVHNCEYAVWHIIHSVVGFDKLISILSTMKSSARQALV